MTAFDTQIRSWRGRISRQTMLLVAVIVVWIAAILGSLLPKQQALSADLHRALRLTADRRHLIDGRQEIVSGYRQLLSELALLEDEKEDATAIMRTLTAKASGSELQVTRMMPTQAERTGEMARIGADLELTGSMETIVRFLYDIEHGSDPLLVTHLVLHSRAGEQSQMEAQVRAVKILALGDARAGSSPGGRIAGE